MKNDQSEKNGRSDGRYSRQLIIDGWGDGAQERLAAARVGIAGAGGLGSPVAAYLAAAGVGKLVLCDYQDLELSNLNRQVLYGTDDVGAAKVSAAARRLGELNPETEVTVHNERISESNVREVFGGCDLVIDCLDNWETRFVLNRFCVEQERAFLHGGIREHWGQFGLFEPPGTACLACFLDPGQEADTGPVPVYGAIAGAVGSMMAAKALQFLGGLPGCASGELRLLDTLTMTMEAVDLEKRPDCPVCSSNS